MVAVPVFVLGSYYYYRRYKETGRGLFCISQRSISKCLNVVKFKSWYFPLNLYFRHLPPSLWTPSLFLLPISCIKCVSVVRIFRCFIVLNSYSFARLTIAHQCDCVIPFLPEILAFEGTPLKTLDSTFP